MKKVIIYPVIATMRTLGIKIDTLKNLQQIQSLIKNLFKERSDWSPRQAVTNENLE